MVIIFFFLYRFPKTLFLVFEKEMLQNKNEDEKNPEISFGYLERSVSNGMMGYIFVITLSFQTKAEQIMISNKLGQIGLEYFIIENDPDYRNLPNMEKGLGIYVKKHEESDLDHSKDFFLGYTVYETFRLLLSELEKYYESPIVFKEDAIEKVIKFKEKLIKEIDWETIIIAMPELSDLDKMLNELLERQKK